MNTVIEVDTKEKAFEAFDQARSLDTTMFLADAAWLASDRDSKIISSCVNLKVSGLVHLHEIDGVVVMAAYERPYLDVEIHYFFEEKEEVKRQLNKASTDLVEHFCGKLQIDLCADGAGRREVPSIGDRVLKSIRQVVEEINREEQGRRVRSMMITLEPSFG